MCKKYDPLKDTCYMSNCMKKFFRRRLVSELKELNKKSLAFGETLQADSIKEADSVDQSALTQIHLDHLAHHEHDLLRRNQIEAALKRLYCGNYGYCLATGEQIGVERLLAAPCALYCVDVQLEKEDRRRSM